MRKMSTKLSQIKVLSSGGIDAYHTVIFLTVFYSKQVNLSLLGNLTYKVLLAK